MKTLIMMVGLPQSGKSTLARKISAEKNAPIVNPDSIRLALHGKDFIGVTEPYVWAITRTMINALFMAGHNEVILDATNTTRKRRDEWKKGEWDARVFYVLETSKNMCLYQAEKSKPALIPVIQRMAEQYESVDQDEYYAINYAVGPTDKKGE